ncbi:hypothetical protein [Halomonas sp. NCCP-2165]|nr:hypothetical protein [Halomonas sp. NCCP-2165]GKW47876.1 hypothetical protein NCCP2165_00910 [Halomonas sp. NCCP-2165]
MTLTLIWLISFAIILFLSLKRWEHGLGGVFEKKLPEVLRTGTDERWVWCPALAVLGATFIVRPVDVLLTLIVIALVVTIGGKLVCWAMSKAKLH